MKFDLYADGKLIEADIDIPIEAMIEQFKPYKQGDEIYFDHAGFWEHITPMYTFPNELDISKGFYLRNQAGFKINCNLLNPTEFNYEGIKIRLQVRGGAGFMNPNDILHDLLLEIL